MKENQNYGVSVVSMLMAKGIVTVVTQLTEQRGKHHTHADIVEN
jgi:hypothetical protein